ncbi:MAG TPA: hypothetical protein VLJ59_08015 [Mycobacteriales bacterium]|nr:hypothetical protein [Mycobacteriales bacterium]
MTAPSGRRVPAVDRLRADAETAAQVRALTTHPDVVALRTERVRSQVDALIWVGLLLGLAFTMVNVQTFAAAGAAAGSLAWCAAWLLDPMVSLVLVAVLRAEQVTARYQVACGPWPARTKLFAFTATYVMNTWQSWQVLNAAGIVLHSVPPLLVYCAAEVGPVLRDRLTEATTRAAPTATTTTTRTTDAPDASGQAAPPEPEHAAAEPGRRPVPRKATVTRKPAGRTPATPQRRRLFAEYLADARAALAPGVVVTPAWVRQVTGCSRGLSPRLARALTTDTPATAPAMDMPAVDGTDTVAELEGRAA